MLERDIEKKLVRPIRDLCGRCLKFETPGFTGVPDRIILLPGAHIVFVETKHPGKKERARQVYVHGLLRAMGFTVYSTIDSVVKVAAIIEDCRRLVYGESV